MRKMLRMKIFLMMEKQKKLRQRVKPIEHTKAKLIAEGKEVPAREKKEIAATPEPGVERIQATVVTNNPKAFTALPLVGVT